MRLLYAPVIDGGGDSSPKTSKHAHRRHQKPNRTHGTVEPGRLYESPYTDLASHGPDGLFSSEEIDHLVAALESVRSSAVAA